MPTVLAYGIMLFKDWSSYPYDDCLMFDQWDVSPRNDLFDLHYDQHYGEDTYSGKLLTYKPKQILLDEFCPIRQPVEVPPYALELSADETVLLRNEAESIIQNYLIQLQVSAGFLDNSEQRAEIYRYISACTTLIDTTPKLYLMHYELS